MCCTGLAAKAHFARAFSGQQTVQCPRPGYRMRPDAEWTYDGVSITPYETGALHHVQQHVRCADGLHCLLLASAPECFASLAECLSSL